MSIFIVECNKYCDCKDPIDVFGKYHDIFQTSEEDTVFHVTQKNGHYEKKKKSPAQDQAMKDMINSGKMYVTLEIPVEADNEHEAIEAFKEQCQNLHDCNFYIAVNKGEQQLAQGYLNSHVPMAP